MSYPEMLGGCPISNGGYGVSVPTPSPPSSSSSSPHPATNAPMAMIAKAASNAVNRVLISCSPFSSGAGYGSHDIPRAHTSLSEVSLLGDGDRALAEPAL